MSGSTSYPSIFKTSVSFCYLIIDDFPLESIRHLAYVFAVVIIDLYMIDARIAEQWSKGKKKKTCHLSLSFAFIDILDNPPIPKEALLQGSQALELWYRENCLTYSNFEFKNMRTYNEYHLNDLNWKRINPTQNINFFREQRNHLTIYYNFVAITRNFAVITHNFIKINQQ
ncbi:hypothetical protein ACJX0J_010571 [Zea mays]